MGLIFNNHAYKRGGSLPNVSSTVALKQLTPSNILFLRQIGLIVKQ